MSHPTWQVFGTFDEPVNAYKGMQMGHVMVQDYYARSRRRGVRRGFVLISYMMTPITYANLSGSFYGAGAQAVPATTIPYTAAWWAHAEGLPDADNTVTLDPEVKDAARPAGRAADVRVGRERREARRRRARQGAEMMAASGARKVRIGLNYGAHAMGSCRMGDDPRTSVVNAFCQSHDVPNLFVCDTSVFVTGSGVNPTLTAMAIASRAAEHVAHSARRNEL